MSNGVFEAKDILDKIEVKVLHEIKRLKGGIPYIPVDGSYQNMAEKDISWWTNGFWGGMLWQLYHATQVDEFRQAAEKTEVALDDALSMFNNLHHDVGFMWLHTSVANFRLTQNEKSKSRGLHAATILAGRYNPTGKFIRCWNEDKTGWVIIDSLMNLPLLYWATAITKDPRFSKIAENHAETILKYMIRGDGSCSHIGIFDPVTGEFIKEDAGQGFADNSSWSRGQSWGIYGMALSYRHTKRPEFLDAAKSIANYFIANVSQTGHIPLVDFKAPESPAYYDTSAGLCAACGMLEISEHVSEYEKKIYHEAATEIIKETINSYSNWDNSKDGIIGGGTVAYHRDIEIEVPIIYTDYFLIEGILRLLHNELDVW